MRIRAAPQSVLFGKDQPPLLTRVELYYSLEGIREAMDAWAEGGDPVVAEGSTEAPASDTPPAAAR